MFVEIANNVTQAAIVLRDLLLNFQQVQDSAATASRNWSVAATK